MSWLLALIPVPYRWLMLAVFAASLFGFGYLKGLQHEEAILNEFKTKIQTLGEVQAAKVASTITQQKQITERAKNEANDLRNRLSRYYSGGVLSSYAGASTLPPIPYTTPGTNEATSQSKTDTAGTVAAVDAAQDALTVKLLQKWIQDQAGIQKPSTGE